MALPAELTKKDDDAHEVLYERMRLVEALEATLEALWSDFLALRLSEAWEATCVPVFGQFAHDEEIDEAAYTKAKQRALGKRAKRLSAGGGDQVTAPATSTGELGEEGGGVFE